MTCPHCGFSPWKEGNDPPPTGEYVLAETKSGYRAVMTRRVLAGKKVKWCVGSLVAARTMLPVKWCYLPEKEKT